MKVVKDIITNIAESPVGTSDNIFQDIQNCCYCFHR
jgi:hypothetical protein